MFAPIRQIFPLYKIWWLQLIASFFTLLLILNLTSCGFHLRGVVAKEIPYWLDKISIQVGAVNPDLKTRLTEKLQNYYRTICYTGANAQYTLFLEQDEWLTNISSVSSATTPRQYQIIYRLWFSLTRHDGKVIIPLNYVTVSRTVTINNDRILGSGQEEDLTKSSMREDAVLQILNTLSKLSN